MIEGMKGGYVALAFVGVAFFGLQVWWISMTISNGKNERVQTNQHQTDKFKKRLEKIFSKTD